MHKYCIKDSITGTIISKFYTRIEAERARALYVSREQKQEAKRLERQLRDALVDELAVRSKKLPLQEIAPYAEKVVDIHRALCEVMDNDTYYKKHRAYVTEL